MQERREREHSEENEDCSVKKQRADCLEVEIVPLDFINAVDAAVALAAAQKVKPRALALLGVRGLQLRTNFLTREEEKLLMSRIDKCAWNTSLQRRTQHYGYEYDYKSKGVAKLAPPIPEWCHYIVDRLLDQSVLLVRPDQLIVNEYEPGQGIFPHVDSTASSEDGIVSISLASDIVMEFVHQATGERKEAVLPRCSALSLHGVARYEWRHGITARKTDHAYVWIRSEVGGGFSEDVGFRFVGYSKGASSTSKEIWGVLACAQWGWHVFQFTWFLR
jgi:alkylated DNA repair dioxygenase AlkB